MRRFAVELSNTQSSGLNHRHCTFRRVGSVMIASAVLSVASAFAAEPVGKPATSTANGIKVPAHSDTEAVIPECLDKLKLSAQQQEQIKGIIHDYDRSIAKVWKQFGDRYMQTVKLESTLLAAIEDHFTDDQRKHVRDQRRKTAQHEKMIASTTTTPNQETKKPASAVEEETAGVGVSMTSEQTATAEKIQDKYRPQLRSLNRDIQGLHIRLVSLEADRLVAIEKVLTKEQLEQLRSDRQNAPEAPKIEITTTEPTKVK